MWVYHSYRQPFKCPKDAPLITPISFNIEILDATEVFLAEAFDRGA